MPFLKDKSKIYTSKSKELNKLSMKEGLRHAVINPLGDKYKGEWRNNEKGGKGLLLTRIHDQYEGDFDRNYRHGFGVLSYKLENQTFCLEYRGDYRNGKRHGFGLMKYRDGSVYMGWWRKGKRHGFGRMWYLNGDFYEGEWKKDKRHGCGMLLRSDDNWYQGEWANDMKNGRGAFIHVITGQMQKGFWVNDFCVCSSVIDIYYRQNAYIPSYYPIDINKLLNPCQVYDEREMKFFIGENKSCLTIKSSTETGKNETN